jgi:hypothetical protein
VNELTATGCTVDDHDHFANLGASLPPSGLLPVSRSTIQRPANADSQRNRLLHPPTVEGRTLTGTPAKTGGDSLDPMTRTGLESSFGQALDHVRVHIDSAAEQSALQHRSRAYTIGAHIFLGKDEGASGTADRRHVLAHEVAHVIQQTSKGRTVSPAAAEAEAEGAARSVARGAPTLITGAVGVGVQAMPLTQNPAGKPPPPSYEEIKKLSPELKGMAWSTDFAKGFEMSGAAKQIGNSWDAVKANMDPTTSAGAAFWAEFSLGIPVGILSDLLGQLSGLTHLAWELLKLQGQLIFNPVGMAFDIKKEIEKLAKDVPPLLMALLDSAEPLGREVGNRVGKKATKFALGSPGQQGLSIGEAVGVVVAEVALLFLGVAEVSAGVKALRSTSLGRAIMEVLAGSKYFKPLLEAKELGQGVVKAGEAAGEVTREAKLAEGAAQATKEGLGTASHPTSPPKEMPGPPKDIQPPKALETPDAPPPKDVSIWGRGSAIQGRGAEAALASKTPGTHFYGNFRRFDRALYGPGGPTAPAVEVGQLKSIDTARASYQGKGLTAAIEKAAGDIAGVGESTWEGGGHTMTIGPETLRVLDVAIPDTPLSVAQEAAIAEAKIGSASMGVEVRIHRIH